MLNEIECVFEKKKWISVTGLCNNNCVFCLDKGRSNNHRDKKDIKDEIKLGFENGSTRLVLSGGDPTVHPDIIELVRFGAGIGYKKIQLITNGRMFSSEKFTSEIINAGVTEVTFSIHGDNKELHDKLTNVPGSFYQVLKGVKNVSKRNVIINTDTCITKSNYMYLPRIIEFIVKVVGIHEVNLMSMVPFGNAWKYKEDVLYEYSKVAPYVKKVLDFCKEQNVVVWLSRFPAEYLEGYENYIENPYKRVDEVLAQIDKLKSEPSCKSKRCYYCSINSICKKLINKNKNNLSFNEVITINNLGKLEITNNQTLFNLPYPTLRLKDYNTLKISDVALLMKNYDHKNVYLSGIPDCQLIKNGIRNIKTLTYDDIDYSKPISEVIEKLALRIKTKKEACKECILYDQCEGVYINYVRKFGFTELIPIKQKEIRINLECNQDCLFCNTDINSEDIILDEDEIIKKIELYSKQGINYITFSGKEPTLDRNLIKYIKLAKLNGFLKIELQSNAIRLSNIQYTKELKQVGLTDGFISLHAHNEELSTTITNTPNTFNKTVIGIKNLIDQDINVTINIVVNSYNYSSLLDITKFICNLGVMNVVFSIVAPVAKAQENIKVIPKYSNITSELKSAFEYCKSKGIQFSIPSRCGIPICLIEDYKEYHDEFRSSKRFHNTIDKVKHSNCRTCKYNAKCTGLWKPYVKIFGFDEIK